MAHREFLLPGKNAINLSLPNVDPFIESKKYPHALLKLATFWENKYFATLPPPKMIFFESNKMLKQFLN